ncbi:MAG: hypothetical protein SF172_15965 [Burkholderiales bacterium]|nr:hypothetical protein [Burkholderiales bacterium]
MIVNADGSPSRNGMTRLARGRPLRAHGVAAAPRKARGDGVANIRDQAAR